MTPAELEKMAREYARVETMKLAQTWGLPNQERFVETIRVIKRDFIAGHRARDGGVAKLRGAIESVLYAQLGGCLNPDKVGKEVLDKARSALAGDV